MTPDFRSLIALVEHAHTPDITQSAEFQDWFRGSKVVDRQGRPLRVYHGTTADISVFGDHDEIPDRGGLIAFFSTSPEFASGYATEHDGANVMPCYLRIEKPFDFRQHWHWADDFWEETGGISDRYEINRILMGLGHPIENIDDEGYELSQEQFLEAVKSGSWDALEAPEFVEWLREYGYDGIVMLENGAVNFGVFEPTQVKSAFNQGTFDPDAEHIGENARTSGLARLMEEIAAEQQDAFQRWFAGSRITNPDGSPLVLYHGTSKDQDFAKFRVPKNGVWFTTDRESASQYAVENDSKNLKLDWSTGRYVEVNTASRVMPVYVRALNPLHLDDFPDSLKYASNYRKAQGIYFDQLRAQGYDSVVFSFGVVVVIGDATQIKSAIGNRGTWDPKRPNMVEGVCRLIDSF